jgi:hypothetical protein
VAEVEHDLAALAAELRNVPGVVAAEISGHDPASVRLVLDSAADGVVVAEAVSRLLNARPGAAAATPPSVTVTVPEQRAARPGIVRLDVAVTDRESLAHVVLSAPSGSAAGDATSTATSRGQLRAVAGATVVAVEELLGGQIRIELDYVDIAAYGPDRTALVGLTVVGLSGAERLTGSAAVREDESRAVVRAVLDAMNRRLEAWLR